MQRWAESYFLRMPVISNLFTELNMTRKRRYHIFETLKPHNIKNDNMCLGQILDMIKANMNPLEQLILYIYLTLHQLNLFHKKLKSFY